MKMSRIIRMIGTEQYTNQMCKEMEKRTKESTLCGACPLWQPLVAMTEGCWDGKRWPFAGIYADKMGHGISCHRLIDWATWPGREFTVKRIIEELAFIYELEGD